MQREILFRGKRKDNGEWVYGYFVHIPCGRRSKDEYLIQTIKENGTIGLLHEIIPETLGRYTGLTDKNGVKIFEGDIVSNEWCFICGNSVVKFGEYDMSREYQQGHYGFYLEHLAPTEKAVTRKDMMYFANNCVVIGNIHDNPEVLEVK
jgi:uncharacterized phage protein (TIGR01671 family)